MATIVEKTKDGKIVSFKIMVLLGRDEKNKQRFKCKTWHPDKGMRHTFARNYYIQTRDVYALSKLLGHSSVAVTENYLRDLGMETFFSDANYNPQQQFSQAEKRRRGKMQ